MPNNLQLYVDCANRLAVAGPASTVPAQLPPFFQGDKIGVDLYFLQPTGNIFSPYDFAHYVSPGIRLGVGRVSIPTAGTFTLTFGANTTAALAYNISAAALQTALQGLASIGSGNILVTGDNVAGFVLTFTAGKGATNVALITANSANLSPDSLAIVKATREGAAGIDEVQSLKFQQLTAAYTAAWSAIGGAGTATPSTIQSGNSAAGTGTVTTVQSGNAATVTAAVTATQNGNGSTLHEIQTVTFSAPPVAGTYVINFGGVYGSTVPIAFDAQASVIAAAIYTVMPALGVVVGNFVAGVSFDMTWTAGFTDYPTATVSGTGLVSGSLHEIQRVTFGAAPISGSYSLGFAGYSNTSAIAWNATAAQIETIINEILGANAVNVTLIDGVSFDITWSSFANITALTFTAGTLKSATLREIQRVTLSAPAVGGTFTLTFTEGVTAPIAFDASGGDIETAINDLIGENAVTVTGDATTFFTITWASYLNQTQLTFQATSLVWGYGFTGTLSFDTLGVDQMLNGAASVTDALLELELTPSGGNPETLLQQAVTVKNDLLENGVYGSTASPAANPWYRSDVVGLSDLVAVPTAGGILPTNQLIIFQNDDADGSLDTYELFDVGVSGTVSDYGQPSDGVTPNDYNASTNHRVWLLVERIDSRGNDYGVGYHIPPESAYALQGIHGGTGRKQNLKFRATIAADQTVTTSTDTKINFDTRTWDTATDTNGLITSTFSTANKRFTPTTGGHYLVSAVVKFSEVNANSTILNLWKNGALFQILSQVSNHAVNTCFNVTCPVYLNGTTDYIELYAWHNKGSSMTIQSGVTTSMFSANKMA
jgi:hypothetical protein